MKIKVLRFLMYTLFLTETSDGWTNGTAASKGKLLLKNLCLGFVMCNECQKIIIACMFIANSGHIPPVL